MLIMHTRPNEHKELVKKIEELIQQNKNRKSRNSISEDQSRQKKLFRVSHVLLKGKFFILADISFGEIFEDCVFESKIGFLE